MTTHFFHAGIAILRSPRFLDSRSMLPFLDCPTWFWVWRQPWFPIVMALATALVIVLLPGLIGLFGDPDSRL
jgi:hypothetical protein